MFPYGTVLAAQVANGTVACMIAVIAAAAAMFLLVRKAR